MSSYANLIAAWAKAKLDGKAKGQTQSNRDSFAVEDGSRPGYGFNGVAKSVAKVKERPGSRSILEIVGDKPQFRFDATRYRGQSQFVVACEQRGAIGFAPFEKGRVVNQAIFGDFGVASAQLPSIECMQERRISYHQRWLVKGPDEIFLAVPVDRRFPADRAVGLGKQSGRDLDDRAAALEERGGQPGDIADRAATKRQDRGVASDAPLGQLIEDRSEDLPAFRGFTLGHEDRFDWDDCPDPLAIKPVHALVGDERQDVVVRQATQLAGSVRQWTDEDCHSGLRRAARAATMLSTTSLWAPVPLRTWICASA